MAGTSARGGSSPPPKDSARGPFEGVRVLELSGKPTLDDARAQYRRLAQRYYPKTQSSSGDEAHAAEPHEHLPVFKYRIEMRLTTITMSDCWVSR